MSIFTKRNAAVGYVTLKTASHLLERRRRNRRGKERRRSAYLALGLLSFGILAGVAAVLVRRRQRESAEPEGAESPDAGAVAESEIVGEYVPIPAT